MSPSTGPPALESLIAEHEHQALDLLDALPAGSADPDEAFLDAVELVRGLLTRLVSSVARTLLDAAHELAQTEDRGSIETGMLDEIRLTLDKCPRLSLAIVPAVETTGVLLGLDRKGTAWAVLDMLMANAQLEAGEPLHTCSSAIGDQLWAAQPKNFERIWAAQPKSDRPLPRALWVFRCAAVAQGGPSIRARLLAAEHPEHLALARVLVEQHHDAAALVDAFVQARDALAAASPTPAGVPQIDGPKRKFTYVHVILALIVLGLTLWHYAWR